MEGSIRYVTQTAVTHVSKSCYSCGAPLPVRGNIICCEYCGRGASPVQNDAVVLPVRKKKEEPMKWWMVILIGIAGVAVALLLVSMMRKYKKEKQIAAAT